MGSVGGVRRIRQKPSGGGRDANDGVELVMQYDDEWSPSVFRVKFIYGFDSSFRGSTVRGPFVTSLHANATTGPYAAPISRNASMAFSVRHAASHSM